MLRLITLVTFLALTFPAYVCAGSVMYDFTTAGASNEINNAWFYQNDPRTTGSGALQSFLRIQSNGVEEGYNTDYRRHEFDEKKGAFTSSLMLSDVPVVTRNGLAYREFGLDINENKSTPDRYLSLDSLQIFLGKAPDLHGYPDGLGTKVYDLDAVGDSWLKLDYGLGAGSGSGDLFAYIPDKLFEGSNQYVYLYSKFGAEGNKCNGLGSTSGFEEWFVRTGNGGGIDMTPVPEPSSAVVLALCTMPVVGAMLKRRR